MTPKASVAIAMIAIAVCAPLSMADPNPGHLEPQSVVSDCESVTAVVGWEPVGDPHLAGYDVYRRPAGNQEFAKANSEVVTPTTYEVSGLQAGTTYDFGVVAVYTDGHESAMSELATCTTGQS